MYHSQQISSKDVGNAAWNGSLMLVLGLRSTGHRRSTMPEKETLERARRDKESGKSPSTQAGEFVREEIHHVREGKHGARSTKQAIAIGLSKARKAVAGRQDRSERRH